MLTQLNIAISILVEVDCGVPPPIPHSIMLWDQISTLGSQVVYQCNSGYRRVGEGNVSACTASGDWVGASLLCQGTHDINLTQWSLGLPDLRKGYHAIFMSAILHNFHDVVELNECSCSTGITTTTCVHYPAMTCCLVVVEISCQEPVFKPRAKTMWDGTSHIGTVVHYQCEEGYYTSGLRNYSVCGENGLWEDIDLWCEGVTFDIYIYILKNYCFHFRICLAICTKYVERGVKIAKNTHIFFLIELVDRLLSLSYLAVQYKAIFV